MYTQVPAPVVWKLFRQDQDSTSIECLFDYKSLYYFDSILYVTSIRVPLRILVNSSYYDQ